MIEPRKYFAPLLDPKYMASAFQRHLPECVSGEWELTGCDVQHPRYKTYLSSENRERSSLSLVYHLHGRPHAAGLTQQRIVYARAYLGDRSWREFEKAKAAGAPECDGALLHLSDLGVVGWRFPHDPAMPWLAELLDAGRVAGLIPEAGKAFHCVNAEVVNYRPETRCTTRYRLRRGKAEVVVYGKTYADKSGVHIHDNLLALGLQSHAAETFALPRPRGYDAGHSTLWLDELRGTPLPADLSGEEGARLIDRLCQSLALFHRMEVPHCTPITQDQQLHEWGKKAGKLSHAYPALSASLSDLLADLERERPASRTATLIHGDFHVGQLSVMSGGRLALFDFDELASGDPWQDVSNFAADLFVQSFAADMCKELSKRLLAAYQHHSGESGAASRFAWQLRGQLLTRAYRAHIQQKKETEGQVMRLLALALPPSPLP